jgi:outer membrane protein assembly factor BamB
MSAYTLIKDKWIYKMKGIRKPSVTDPIIDTGKLYFSVMQGFPYNGSHVLEMDISSLDVKTVLEEEYAYCHTPFIDSGKLYVVPINSSNICYCIDQSTHSILWTWKDVQRSNTNMNVSVGKSGANIIVADLSKNVYCIDEHTQKTKWRFEPSDSCRSEFYIEDNYLYFGTSSGTGVYCLDIHTGTVIWECAQERYTKHIASFSDTNLVVLGARSVLVINKKTGKILSDVPFSGLFDDDIDVTVQLHSEFPFVYINDIDLGLVCYHYSDDKGLEIKWHFKMEEGLTGGFLDFQNTIICSAGDKSGKNNHIYILEADTGIELTSQKSKELANYIVRDDKRLFLLSDKGQIELMHLVAE